jgi:hypothetical protein
MVIMQGQSIDYTGEKWNIQADYTSCDVKNKRLLSIENYNFYAPIIDLAHNSLI